MSRRTLALFAPVLLVVACVDVGNAALPAPPTLLAPVDVTLPAPLAGPNDDARDLLHAYWCGDETLAGDRAEVLYRVDVPEAGFLALQADDDADTLLVVLASPSAHACVAAGTHQVGAFVEAGTSFIAIEGTGTVRAALTTPASLRALGLGDDVADDALRAFARAWANGDTDRFTYAITDFSLRSSLPREWIIDLATGALLWNLHVAHGENTSDPSDRGFARAFSNDDGSHQSSLGMMRAGEDYEGSYGHSVRLDGLEDGTNDAVRDRAIVLHPWTGSRPAYVDAQGMTAETWGCPAIDDRVTDDVIAAMQGGGLFFFWYPDAAWRAASPYLP